MTLSADLKAIHATGKVTLSTIAGIYVEMGKGFGELVGSFQGLTREGAGSAWPEALNAMTALMQRAADNMTQASDVLQLIAYAYAATDETAAANLEKAAGLDGPKDYIYGEWR